MKQLDLSIGGENQKSELNIIIIYNNGIIYSGLPQFQM